MREVNLTSKDGSEEMLSVSHLTGVTPRSEKTVYMFEAESTVGHKLVQPGDLVINTMWAWMGAAGVSKVDGIVSPAYGVYRIDQNLVDPRWIDRLIRTPAYVTEMTRVSRGVTSSRLRLYPDEFLRLNAPVPPIEEQRAIADYLDTETVRIDALITKKRRLLELIDEARQARIAAAVAPGGQWGDDVTDEALSEGWQRPRLGSLTSIAEGQVDPRQEPWSSMPLIAPNHVKPGTGELVDSETAAEQGAISGKYICIAGDIVYSKIRPELRKATKISGQCLCSADMYPIRCAPNLRPDYLLYLLLSDPFTELAVLESDRVAMPKINRDALSRIRINLPPVALQDRLVDELDKVSSEARRTTKLLARQIDLLIERRQTVITAAVTGELGIRAVSA